MKKLQIEKILERNTKLKKDINRLSLPLEGAQIIRPLLCYCASTPELYENFCDYLAKKIGILSEAIFKVFYEKDNGRDALEKYLMASIIPIERTSGNIVFIQAKGFTELAAANIPDNDSYSLSRFGHDYDQFATEDFYLHLGRIPSKSIFVLTHLDKSHTFYDKAIRTAAGSQFKFLIFDI